MRVDAFGLALQADFPLPGARIAAGEAPAAPGGLTASVVPPGTLFGLTADPRRLRHLVAYEGCPFATLEGETGDLLFHFGSRAMFHLDDRHRHLRCEFTAGPDRLSERVLLDTVLWTISLARGHELLHAAAVTTPAGVLALVADQGGGKSTLAAEFLRRGSALFADDILALSDGDGRLVGHPGPAVMNLPLAVDPAAVRAAEILGRFGDEHWVAVKPVPQAPAPPAAIVLVHRAPGESLRCERVAATTLTLLPFAVTLPHMTARRRRRFELFGRLAETTPVLRLTADPATPAAALADAVAREVL